MSAQIINLRDVVIRTRRRQIRVVAPNRVPLAELIPGETFEIAPDCIRPLREAIVFALFHADAAVAMAAIEEFTALPVDDADAALVRDGAALAFCAMLQQRAAPAAEDDDASEFFDRIINRLFPLSAGPSDPAA